MAVAENSSDIYMGSTKNSQEHNTNITHQGTTANQMSNRDSFLNHLNKQNFTEII